MNYGKQKGFTLVEIVVSLAIFALVSLIAVGALLKIIDANKKSQSLKTSINNVNYILDSMSREMRNAGNLYCISGNFILNTLPAPTGCNTSTAPWTVAFYSTRKGSNCRLINAYRYETQVVGGVTVGSLRKAEQANCGDFINSTGDYKVAFNPRPFAPIMSDNVIITDAHITVETGNTSTVGQPRVFLHMKGYSGVKEKNRTPFDIQTFISQRIND